jgi:hypothetical protein
MTSSLAFIPPFEAATKPKEILIFEHISYEPTRKRGTVKGLAVFPGQKLSIGNVYT